MPITEEGFQYQMPDGIKHVLTDEILKDFLNILIKEYERENEIVDYINFVGHTEGTIGWGKSFKVLCDTHNLNWLYEYYRHLPWYESDLFCSSIGDLMMERGIIEYGELIDIDDYEDIENQ